MTSSLESDDTEYLQERKPHKIIDLKRLRGIRDSPKKVKKVNKDGDFLKKILDNLQMSPAKSKTIKLKKESEPKTGGKRLIKSRNVTQIMQSKKSIHSVFINFSYY